MGGFIVHGMYQQILGIYFDGDRARSQRDGIPEKHETSIFPQLSGIANQLRVNGKSRMQDENGKMEATLKDSADQPEEIPDDS